VTRAQPKFICYRHGFTLLEVLVVITIVGILAGLTLLSFGALDQRRLTAETDRLRLALNHAVDASLLRQETIGWFYDSAQNSYEFKILPPGARKITGESWYKMSDSIFAAHNIYDSATLYIDTTLTTSQGTRRIERGATNAQLPALVFLASGEYTPFQIHVSDNTYSSITLQGDGFGAVSKTTLEAVRGQ
jgi:prepilin-type N-terminal cleavage/methylation domain-containing protein